MTRMFAYFGLPNDEIYIKKEAVLDYIGSKDFTEIVGNDADLKIWSSHQLNQAVQNKVIKADDQVILYDAQSLANTADAFLGALTDLFKHHVNIYFVAYEQGFSSREQQSTDSMLSLMQSVAQTFADIRARNKAGLGRPKGKRNKSLKLDKHSEDILRYLKLGISKASIAKLVECHPQTLYDWMNRRGIPYKKEERDALEAPQKD